MKKTLIALSLLFLLSACGGPGAPGPAESTPKTLTVAATTYPVYLFATAVTEGVEGVEVKAVVNQQMSCLHDYTLSVNDMKALEGADVIVMNGVGLEDFMSDALDASSAAVIDCSQGVALLPYKGHEDHGDTDDDGEHWDPHIWMDPDRGKQMMRNIADGLAALDPIHADQYEANCDSAAERLDSGLLREDALPNAQHWDLITFHDGFQYFSTAFTGHAPLMAIEEEEGSEASAQEIKEIVSLIQTRRIPVIFTEVNGSDSTAKAIQRETGAAIEQLTMLMSGDGSGIEPYIDGIRANCDALMRGFAEETP